MIKPAAELVSYKTNFNIDLCTNDMKETTTSAQPLKASSDGAGGATVEAR